MRTPSLLVAIVTSLTSLSIAPPAAADIVYLSQLREIRADAFVNGQPQGGSDMAPNFADWESSITRTFPGQNRVATASQVSRLLPNAIEVTGSASVSLGQGGVPSVEGHAASTLDVAFRLDSETPFRVDHAHTSMSTTPNFSVRLALVRLTGPTGIAFEWEEDQGHPSSWPSSPFLGVLGPGEYELEVIIAAFRATATGSFGSSSASASFAMSIPSVGGASLAAASLLAMRQRPRRPSLVHKTGRVLQSVFLLAVLVGAVGLPATRAAADIVYLTQDRDIEASAFVDGQPQGGGLNAPDFADWDRSITRTFPGQNRIATASQNSRLLSDAILFTGAGSVSFGQPDVPVVEGRAASTLDVRFRLDSEMPFRIDHAHTSMSTSPNFSGRLARARLTGRAGLIFEWSESQDLPNTWPSTPYFGILMPGDYQVELTVSATRSTPTGSFGASSASASFAMSIPSVGGAGLAGVSLLALRRRPRR